MVERAYRFNFFTKGERGNIKTIFKLVENSKVFFGEEGEKEEEGTK